MSDKIILGIDEAGMGPVFGPLVISGAVVKKNDTGRLKEVGVKDSKMFGSGLPAHLKREKIWAASLPYIIEYKHIIIEPRQLDKHNMYDLHIEATKKILKDLKWYKIDEVYIEQVGGLQRNKYFSRIGFWHRDFIYEQKADIKYAVVSLASINAKIQRDRLVSKLCEDLNEEYVSGYANSSTEAFFRRYHEKNGCLPPGTRLSRKWAPIEELLNK